MNKNTNSSGGIGTCSVLFIIFLVLKLVGTISWSWWWIFSPLWIPASLVVLVVIVAALIYLIRK